MAKKVELKILGLSYSETSLASYILVLSDTTSNKKIPIIIKPSEANAIALEMEGMGFETKYSKIPSIHQIVKLITENLEADVTEVFIYKVVEGVFYCKIFLSKSIDPLDDIEIECSVGDAIALSEIFKCPIHTTRKIINSVGISTDEEGTPIDDDTSDNSPVEYKEEAPKRKRKAPKGSAKEEEVSDSSSNAPGIIPIPELKKLISKALKTEDYELAAQLRDQMNEMISRDKNNSEGGEKN
jgi:uncharacterized protein